jgi:hypothetical protein
MGCGAAFFFNTPRIKTIKSLRGSERKSSNAVEAINLPPPRAWPLIESN